MMFSFPNDQLARLSRNTKYGRTEQTVREHPQLLVQGMEEGVGVGFHL